MELLEHMMDCMSGNTIRYSALEAIIDGFESAHLSLVQIETSDEPSHHKILTSFQFHMSELGRIQLGDVTFRGDKIK